MDSRKRFTGAQNALITLVIFLTVGLLGALMFLLQRGAAAQSPSPTPSQAATATALPTKTATFTPSPTASSTPTPSATPSPTPLAPLACLPVDMVRVDAEVRAVVSGSVIVVKENGARYFVRYLGVDPFGDGLSSAAYNRELVEGQTVSLYGGLTDNDGQGNMLRFVVVGERLVNFEMVRQGMALVGLYPAFSTCLDTLLAGQALAKQESLGYWGLDSGTPLAPIITPPEAACDCDVRYACTDFSSQSAAQACYNACGDYRNVSLDPDYNGLACDE